MNLFASRHKRRAIPPTLAAHWFNIALAALVVLAGVIGCSTGSSTTGSSAPGAPTGPPSDFAVNAGLPSAFSLQQNGIPQAWSPNIGLDGVAAPVTFTFPNLPTGVVVFPSGPITVTSDVSLNLITYATSSAAVGAGTVTLQGTNGVVTHTYTVPLTVAKAAPFQLTLSPSALSLTQGGVGRVQATVTPASAPVSMSGLSVSTNPSRPDLNTPTISTTGPNEYSLGFYTNYASLPGSNMVLVTATSSANDTSTVILPVTVTQSFPAVTAPTRSTIVNVDANPTGVVYDSTRKLLFVLLPMLNEVRVLSSIDDHVVTKIPVAQLQLPNTVPNQIDEAADGSKVFVGGAGAITTIDASTLQVTGSTPVPQLAGTGLNSSQLATLSTGNVLVLNSYSGHVFLWNPSTGSMTPSDPPGGGPLTTLIRSSKHNRALVMNAGPFATPGALYDAAAGTFIAQGTLPENAANAVMNPDGSQIAVANTASGISVYDASFNLWPVQPPFTRWLEGASQSCLYSLDGSMLYSMAEGVAFNTMTYTPAGLFPVDLYYAMAIDETGMIYGSEYNYDTGMALYAVDASHPGEIPAAAAENPVTAGNSVVPQINFPYALTLPVGDLSVPEPTSIQGKYFSSSLNYSVFVGPPPASASAVQATGVSIAADTLLNFTIPQGTTPGPANVTVTRPDGWISIIPDALSYGPTILAVTPDTVPTTGQTPVTLYGYGLNDVALTVGGTAVQLQVNGSPGNGGALPNAADLIYPIQVVGFKTPAGTPGDADVVLQSAFGSSTLKSGIHYMQDQQSYPMAGQFGGIVYDQQRHLLYVSNTTNNRIEVFNLSTKTFGTPFPVGKSPINMALTQDAAELAVLNATDGTVSAIDLNQGKVIGTYSVLTAAEQGINPNFISLAQINSHNVLIAINGLSLQKLNLDTGSVSCIGVAGCDSTTTNINPGFLPMAVTSTADGTKAFIVSSLQVAILDVTANTLTTAPSFNNGYPTLVLSANQDGTVFDAGLTAYNGQLQYLNTLGNDVFYLDTIQDTYAYTTAEALNPSGSLMFVVNQEYIDAFDVHTGRLAKRIATAEGSYAGNGALVVDETGTKLFSTSNSGINITQIAMPLSIATVNPNTGPGATQVTIRGSGFQNGAVVKLGSVQVAATFVDAMTLNAVIPLLQSGPVQVTVINPNGSQYSFDAAFKVN